MFKDALISLDKFYREKLIIFCLLVAALILIIDYITGKYIQFPILYLIPIGMAAWRSEKPAAYLLALFMPLARVVFYFPWHESQAFPTAVCNAVIAMAALIFYAYLIDRVSWQTKTLESKIKTMEGILPICASCKRIRNEKGEYEQMEKYITEHSDASFSHGICQECARKLYPDLDGKA